MTQHTTMNNMVMMAHLDLKTKPTMMTPLTKTTILMVITRTMMTPLTKTIML